MKKHSVLFLIFIFIELFQSSVWGQIATDALHKKRQMSGEDPLVLAFMQALAASKEGQWGEAEEIILDLSPALKIYAKEFGPDLSQVLQKTAKDKNPGEMAKTFAHVIFLGMKDNFSAAIKERLSNYENAQKYTETSRLYYERVLAGNIKRKDPSVHEEIMRRFEQVQLAIGSVGVLGEGKIDPDPQKFTTAAKTIESSILKIYTYFSQ